MMEVFGRSGGLTAAGATIGRQNIWVDLGRWTDRTLKR